MTNENSKRTIYVEFDRISEEDDHLKTIDDLRVRLDEIETKASQEGFSVVLVDIYGRFDFYNNRKETDEELNERAKKQKEEETSWREARYKEFLRLKKEFEPPT